MNCDRVLQKIKTFADIAEEIASLSTCKRAQVGAVIFPGDFSKIVAIGYNGPAAGLANDSCYDNEGSCGCVHAEINALIKMPKDVHGLRMISTCSPCMTCAGLIINSKAISHVLYVHEYRDSRGISTLLRSEVQVAPITGLSNDLVRQWW